MLPRHAEKVRCAGFCQSQAHPPRSSWPEPQLLHVFDVNGFATVVPSPLVWGGRSVLPPVLCSACMRSYRLQALEGASTLPEHHNGLTSAYGEGCSHFK